MSVFRVRHGHGAEAVAQVGRGVLGPLAGPTIFLLAGRLGVGGTKNKPGRPPGWLLLDILCTNMWCYICVASSARFPARSACTYASLRACLLACCGGLPACGWSAAGLAANRGGGIFRPRVLVEGVIRWL